MKKGALRFFSLGMKIKLHFCINVKLYSI